MPTGYTAAVAEGTVTSFKMFAVTCARAFGAAIELRDEPTGPVPPQLPQRSTYAEQCLEYASTALAQLKAMTPEQVSIAYEADYEATMNRWKERKKERSEILARCQEMAAKALSWITPTTDHNGLKTFMLDQLQQTIDHDCDDKYDKPPVRIHAEEWHKSQIIYSEDSIVRYTNQISEDKVRHDERNEWLRQLYESLEEEPGNAKEAQAKSDT